MSPLDMSPLIEARALSVHAGNAPVLDQVDLDIAPGEIVTVVGPNGSGKSTLVKALLGILPPSSGRVRRKHGLRIGYVPQKLALDPSLPLGVRRFLSLPHRVSDAEAEAMLERVGAAGLGPRPVAGLSGGQMQRVLLARALLGAPDLLILDEPTQGLDAPGIDAFYGLIEEIRSETGTAVMLVSHDLHVVMRASDRVICLNGHICCEGTPTVVQAAPEYRALFGGSTGGALALYAHAHDHSHDDETHGHHHHHHHHPAHAHAHGQGQGHGQDSERRGDD